MTSLIDHYHSPPSPPPDHLALPVLLATTSLRHPLCTHSATSTDIHGLLDPLFDFGYELFIKVRICRVSGFVGVHTTVLRDGVPVGVTGRGHRLQLGRVLLRISAGVLGGGFRLDPVTGQLVLGLGGVMGSRVRVGDYLEQQFSMARVIFRRYLFYILHLINEVPASFEHNPEITGSIKCLSPQAKSTIKAIERILPVMHLPHPFMYCDSTYEGSKPLSVEQARKMSEAIKATKLLKKQFAQGFINIVKCLQTYNNRDRNQQQLQQFTENERKQYVSRLLDPRAKYPPSEPGSIYTEIEVMNFISGWQVIDEGGFGVISKGVVKFSFKPGKGDDTGSDKRVLFTRQIVKKENYHKQGNKLMHEKKILAQLRQHSSAFIAKYYHSEQAACKNVLLIEYYPHGTLQSLMSRHHQFLTLTTKLTLLRQIAQGLKFLNDHQIQHLDLKPSNIMMSGLLVKIADFGQSYHPELCPKNYRPGTSMPYAPPEVLAPEAITFHPKMDIFSFGMLMHELVFHAHPFHYPSNDHYRRAYADKTYMAHIRVLPERGKFDGYGAVVDTLRYVILRCLDSDDRRRPCIEWLVVMLQYMVGLLNQVAM